MNKRPPSLGSRLTDAGQQPPHYICRYGSPLDGIRSIAFLAKGLACSRYTLTVDELLSWQYSIDRHGLAGLRSTRTQQYRQK